VITKRQIDFFYETPLGEITWEKPAGAMCSCPVCGWYSDMLLHGFYLQYWYDDVLGQCAVRT